MTTQPSIPIGHRMAFHAVQGYYGLSKCMPPALWLGLGRGIGLMLYCLGRKYCRIARANLRFAFGDTIDNNQIEKIIRNNFKQFGMIGNEFVRLLQPPEKIAATLDRIIQVEGEEHLLAARAKSRAVILLGAHFGNWEIGHLYYARHYNRLNFIVRRIDNPLLEKARFTCNTELGVNIIYKDNGLREAIQHLKNGEDLVIFADQNASRKEGITSEFFGHPTTSLYIAPNLAQKYRIPLVPMFTVREKDPRRHRIIFLPEVPIDCDGAKDDIETLTRRQNAILEQIITRFPDHWLWLHRKWKADYPEIYR